MKPRLLLVEDDAISRGFLTAALEALPAQVEAAASCGEALACQGRFDLWLIDANLPDGDGSTLLQRLRAGSPGTVALAHTADPSPALRDRLFEAGFQAVLVKPLTAQSLLLQVGDLLAGHASRTTPSSPLPATHPDWDEDAALQALGGNAEHVALLRQLFLTELPPARSACLAAFDTGDGTALQAALHKLRAGCGFVGAARLAHAVAHWQAAPRSQAARDAFVAAADRLQHG